MSQDALGHGREETERMANAQQARTDGMASERGGRMGPAAGRENGSAAVESLFDRVLVVVDEGAAGRAAAETAVRLAAAHGAAVDALYVVDMVHGWDMEVERREAAGEAAVEEAADRGAAAGVDVEPRFRYGHAHEEVLDFAAAHDSDLIVLGSARRTGVDRLIHPETLPSRVQRGADVPVMTVGSDEV
ncbi:universal stress protein [Haloparvum sedimenti]|uniref:universal stress protein n=1 Tax=Haloparvum sedimenti TaxID=1678448 RepID=UPI001FDFA688|nr:universal stress protein [Haloparvum sedimenti]